VTPSAVQFIAVDSVAKAGVLKGGPGDTELPGMDFFGRPKF